MKKICHFGAEHGKIGGIENYVNNITSVKSECFENFALYLSNEQGVLCKNDRKYIKVRSKILRNKLISGFVAAVYCKAKNIDLIHYHGFGVSVAAPFARLLGIKVIVHGHGTEWKRDKWGLFSKLCLFLIEQISVRTSHIVLTVSREQKHDIEKRFDKRVWVLPGGANLDLIEAITPVEGLGDFFFVSGRIVPEKRIKEVLECYVKVREQKISLPKLILAGPLGADQYSAAIQKLISKNNIAYLGPISFEENIRYLKGAKAFIQYSNLEGRSLAILEALICGKICVLANIPENRELVRELGAEKNVIFVDSQPSLQDAIERSVGIEPEAVSFEHVSWCRVVETYNHILKENGV